MEQVVGICCLETDKDWERGCRGGPVPVSVGTKRLQDLISRMMSDLKSELASMVVDSWSRRGGHRLSNKGSPER